MRCLPVGPKCDECDLSTNGLCPSAQTGKKKVSRARTVKVEVKETPGEAAVTIEISKKDESVVAFKPEPDA